MKITLSIGIAIIAAYVYFAPAMGVRGSARKARIASGAILLFFLILSVLLLFIPTLPGPNDWIVPFAKPVAKAIGLE